MLFDLEEKRSISLLKVLFEVPNLKLGGYVQNGRENWDGEGG